MAVTISVCTILKNEAYQIRRFLEDVSSFADEIIVVDTGSTDGTMDIVRDMAKKNSKISPYSYVADGEFHFGKARNFSLRKAKMDYVLLLDADYIMSDDFKSGIRGFLMREQPIAAFIKRVDDLLPHFVEYIELILKNHQNIFYGTDAEYSVHEKLIHSSGVKKFDAIVWHSQRNNHWLHRPQRIFPQLSLEIDRTPKTKTFFGHFLRGIWYGQFKFKKVYFQQKTYRDGLLGFKFAFLRGLYAFLMQLFVGLKPMDGYRYWEDDRYNLKQQNSND